MITKAPILLASNSPRRQEIMRNAGFEFEVKVRNVEEYIPEDMHPRAVAVMISENKAKAYDDLSNDYIIVTADTIVGLEGRAFGKPADEVEAVAMLNRLSGRSHTVTTGVTIFHGGRFKSFAEETYVSFRRLTDAEIAHYVTQYQPFDKAGAYGIQEWIGMIGITRIEGDYYNVVGLPVGKLYQELLAFRPMAEEN
ncbi:MAG: Maf family nucleotide pyrophosphatase [Bacteroidota bacterium]